ncbi:Hemerythrin; FOG: CheY-like receiver [Candidatus Terasakiella magnetica]|nr:Hemerythrin; FOG: CheY-like receiver [Candidatus Terasakiella magnetica]
MGITWSERMSVGVPALDADHKILIGLINLLQRSIGDSEEYAAVGSVLQSLSEYVAQHFAREEGIMAACRYPLASQHHATHIGFNDRVRQLQARYDESHASVRARDCLTVLNSWLIDHICTADMNYRGWMVGREETSIKSMGVGLAEDPSSGNGPDWGRMRVLVVDDNLNFCQILCTILESVGISAITEMHDLGSARECLGKEHYDLLISDWHVGAESGTDLARWIRRGPPPIRALPILMLSGHERLVNRDIALAAGADEFMEKPISARGLLIGLARLSRKVR